jgi:hypothetical protein
VVETHTSFRFLAYAEVKGNYSPQAGNKTPLTTWDFIRGGLLEEGPCVE